MNDVHVIVNNLVSVNKRQLSGFELEQAFAAKLREILGQAQWLRGWAVEQIHGPDARFDLLVALPLPGGGKAALCVGCKSELRPSQFGQLIGRHFSPPGRFKQVVPVLAMSVGCCGMVILRNASSRASAGSLGFNCRNAARKRPGKNASPKLARSAAGSPGGMTLP